MFVEAIAAGIVGAALLWLVLQPLLMPSSTPDLSFDTPDPEETPRGQALIALGEIDFDRATGKLSESDYEELRSKYSAIAIKAMNAADASAPTDPLEMMIAARAHTQVAAPVSQRYCGAHGSRGETDARFCAICGAGLLTDQGNCVICSAIVPAGAAYCPGCGGKLLAS